MYKQHRLKKFMAILAIILFIGPIFIVAAMNYSTYYHAKKAEKTELATQKTEQQPTDKSTDDVKK